MNPIFSISPTPLAFGNVPTGTTQALVLTITNTGDADLVVTISSPLSPAFTLLDPGTFTIHPSNFFQSNVTFIPSAIGAYSDTIFIDHNDPFQTTPYALSLTGNSVYAFDKTRNAARGTVRVVIDASGRDFSSCDIRAISPRHVGYNEEYEDESFFCASTIDFVFYDPLSALWDGLSKVQRKVYLYKADVLKATMLVDLKSLDYSGDFRSDAKEIKFTVYDNAVILKQISNQPTKIMGASSDDCLFRYTKNMLVRVTRVLSDLFGIVNPDAIKTISQGWQYADITPGVSPGDPATIHNLFTFDKLFIHTNQWFFNDLNYPFIDWSDFSPSYTLPANAAEILRALATAFFCKAGFLDSDNAYFVEKVPSTSPVDLTGKVKNYHRLSDILNKSFINITPVSYNDFSYNYFSFYQPDHAGIVTVAPSPEDSGTTLTVQSMYDSHGKLLFPRTPFYALAMTGNGNIGELNDEWTLLKMEYIKVTNIDLITRILTIERNQSWVWSSDTRNIDVGWMILPAYQNADGTLFDPDSGLAVTSLLHTRGYYSPSDHWDDSHYHSGNLWGVYDDNPYLVDTDFIDYTNATRAKGGSQGVIYCYNPLIDTTYRLMEETLCLSEYKWRIQNGARYKFALYGLDYNFIDLFTYNGRIFKVSSLDYSDVANETQMIAIDITPAGS